MAHARARYGLARHTTHYTRNTMYTCKNCQSPLNLRTPVTTWVDPNRSVREQVCDLTARRVWLREEIYYCVCQTEAVEVVDSDEIEVDQEGFIVG